VHRRREGAHCPESPLAELDQRAWTNAHLLLWHSAVVTLARLHDPHGEYQRAGGLRAANERPAGPVNGRTWLAFGRDISKGDSARRAALTIASCKQAPLVSAGDSFILPADRLHCTGYRWNLESRPGAASRNQIPIDFDPLSWLQPGVGREKNSTISMDRRHNRSPRQNWSQHSGRGSIWPARTSEKCDVRKWPAKRGNHSLLSLAAYSPYSQYHILGLLL
jgi:hypothetical protein